MYLEFTSSPGCTEYVLETIFDKKLHVVQNITQHTLKGHYGNEVRLDISAVDSSNNFYDIEIQRAGRGAHPKRVRYNAVLMDSNYKNPGLHGKDFAETYIRAPL